MSVKSSAVFNNYYIIQLYILTTLALDDNAVTTLFVVITTF